MTRQPQATRAQVFAPGDRLPDFVLPDVLGNAVGLNLSAIGQPLVVIACRTEPERLLQPFVAAVESFKQATVLCITALAPGQNRKLAETLLLPYAVLSDRSGEIVSALAQHDGQGAKMKPLATYVLDPNQRITHVERSGNAERQLERALTALARLLPKPEPLPVPRPAPVLYIPQAIDPAFCKTLIQVWDRQGNEATGTIDALSNQLENVDRQVKVRRDHYVRDQRLLARLSDAIGRRAGAEIEKAFCFRATRIEEFKIACYTGEESGFFRAHRDNLSERTQHRRFAMSLLLNDPDEYEGGELRFAEYGPELYRLAAGDAVIFSCSLLHEVLPVRRGRRFVLLCFLFGDAEARQLAERQSAKRQGPGG